MPSRTNSTQAARAGFRSRAARVELDGEPLAAGDGAALEGPQTLTLSAAADAEVLLFDMA